MLQGHCTKRYVNYTKLYTLETNCHESNRERKAPKHILLNVI